MRWYRTIRRAPVDALFETLLVKKKGPRRRAGRYAAVDMGGQAARGTHLARYRSRHFAIRGGGGYI
jgi:hypothetical protein